MIVWTEQRPDFRRKPVEELLPSLTFTAACAVILGQGCLPKVVAPRWLLDAIWMHLSERNVEMGGLLIGNVHDLDKSGGRFVVSVEDFARADEYSGTGVSLHMGTAVWEAARGKLCERRSVVGWYHSHPNLGAFFSGTDRRTQSAFFSQAHFLGLVIDPIRKEEKWFIGERSAQLESRQILRFD